MAIGFPDSFGFIVVAAPSAEAVVFELNHLNSVFTLTSDYDANMWRVDEVDQLYLQGFWFRMGDTEPEERLWDYYSSEWLSTDETYAVLNYNPPGLEIEVRYSLMGGQPGSKTADVGEMIGIHTVSGANIDMRFFQYSDFDLGGTYWDDRCGSRMRTWSGNGIPVERRCSPRRS